MTRKRRPKSVAQMTPEELDRMAAEFDAEFIADTFGPPSPEALARWEMVRDEPARSDLRAVRVVLEKALLARVDALVKKLGVTRDYLVRKGLKAILEAEGGAKKRPARTAASS